MTTVADAPPTARPPLVAPGPALTAEQAARYSRQLLLPGVGEDGQRRIRAARVAVVGAGGLGSPVLQYLAGAGIGTLGIVDDDDVDVSNLHRQVIHGGSAPGTPKADSAADALAALNPEVQVVRHPVRLTSENALDVLGGYDLVVDGADNFPTRYLVADAAELLGIPVVWGSILRFEGMASVFWTAPPPGHPAVQYRDLFPDPPPPGLVPSCAEGGVLGALCATIGSLLATEALKLVTGVGRTLLGRVSTFDALDASWRELRLAPDPDREPVTALGDYPSFCGLADAEPDAEISPARLVERLARGEVELVDVREGFERDIARIEPSIHLPVAAFDDPEVVERLRDGRERVLYCKTGIRSGRVVARLREAGIVGVTGLGGGIVRWIDDVDPTLRRY